MKANVTSKRTRRKNRSVGRRAWAAKSQSIKRERITSLRNTVEQLDATGECLAGFAEFLNEAKPAEIRLLGEMLGEWQNWGGSLRAGNFFAAVAEAVLHQETEHSLKAWPRDRRKMAAAEADVRNSRIA